LYSSYFNDFQERFLKTLEIRTLEQRCYNYTDVKFMMDDAMPAILEKARTMGR